MTEDKNRIPGKTYISPETDDGATSLRERIANEHPCDQCGKPNYGWFVNPVCGDCCKANHRAVAG